MLRIVLSGVLLNVEGPTIDDSLDIVESLFVPHLFLLSNSWSGIEPVPWRPNPEIKTSLFRAGRVRLRERGVIFFKGSFKLMSAKS